MSNADPRDGVSKTFESKVTSLIAATRHLDVGQILMLRRLTLRDPETRKWASEKQLGVVFSVILSKAVERLGLDKLKAAREKQFLPLLSTGPEGREEDTKILSDVAMQMLGPPPRSEAETTQAGFEALMQRGVSAAAPRINRQQVPLKEPPPLFAAQLGVDGGRLMSVAKGGARLPEGGQSAAPGEDGKPVDFNALFDETICNYSRKILGIFRITGPTKGIRMPFLIAPEFSDTFDEVLRRHLLPQMRATRHLQTLANNYNWAEVGGDKLIDIIQGSEVNNPVLHNWDSRWDAFRAPKVVKKKQPPVKPEDNPWPFFREEATRFNYIPPSEENLQILQDVIRQEADVLAKCWRELVQLHDQEFSPNARQEQAREGAFRDGILRWSQKLPDHMGEHLAIRAFFDLPRCDATFMRRLVGNFGRNDSERRRNAPYLYEFAQNLTG